MNSQNLSQKLSTLVRVAFANRRASRRVPASLPLQFAIVCQQKGSVTGKSRIITARTINLSRNGFSFETSTIQIDGLHLAFNTDPTIYKMLEVEIALPEKGIQLKALPLHYDRDKETGKYIVGVKITAMPPEDRKAFESFLKASASAI